MVKDAAGTCAGGVLTGFPVPTAEKKFDVTGTCRLSQAPASSLA